MSASFAIRFCVLSCPTLLGISAVAFRCAQLANPAAPLSVSRSFRNPEFGSIEAVGACQINTEKVDCWNLQGRHDTALTEGVKAYYIVHFESDLHYVFGRKNRLIVFQRRPAIRGLVDIPHPRSADGRSLPENYGPQLGAYQYEWFSIDADPKDKTTSLSFDVEVPLGQGLLPLKEGAECQIGAMSLRIESIQPGPDRDSYYAPGEKQKTWRLNVAVSNSPNGAAPDLRGGYLDGDGVLIKTVDNSGRPVATAARDGAYAGTAQRMGGNDAALQVFETHKDKLSIYLPVDPASAGSASFFAFATRTVTITNIPLDPR